MLGLQLPFIEITTNVLTEILLPGPATSNPLLSFNDVHTDTLIAN